MTFTNLITLTFILPGVYCTRDFSAASEQGVLARIDLINSLKIALKLSHPAPTHLERSAAYEFVRFLNSSRSNEYLEAFYSTSQVDRANRFQQFLNGILFNGNPQLPIWDAAEILSNMIKTKSDSDKIEALRKILKMFNDSSRSHKLGNPARLVQIQGPKSKEEKGKIKQIDYIQIFEKPHLVSLRSLFVSVMKNLYNVHVP